ncbi:hypothetical protein TD95_004198 [Thielaviopsis punctulata]|uniref:BZIP domain-containing protein n=1 Tax=Thielaviopsis punctulata TaxID=72032 RepID=A0A0F4ZDE7_9PEZI|nr:hypothetical protein TD95_004198 [Thielaviopsis punctulata]
MSFSNGSSNQMPFYDTDQQQHFTPFMQLSAMTPSHANSGPDDFIHTSSPYVANDPNHNHNHNNATHLNSFAYDAAAAVQAHQFTQAPASVASFAPPTPPIQSHAEHTTPPMQQFVGSSVAGDQTPIQSFQGMTPPSQINSHAHSSIPGSSMSASKTSPAEHMQALVKEEALRDESLHRRGGSNSEDEDLTPAQSRRKAQNRAAQRAFRERKERHVKDLEEKLETLRATNQKTASENEELKRHIEEVSTENKILRATGAAVALAGGSSVPQATGPMTYNPESFYDNVLENHPNKTRSHRVIYSESGERMYAAAATWDLIVNSEYFKRGMVNIQTVSDHLKTQARCDGQGPVFCESDIQRAIMASLNTEADELL